MASERKAVGTAARDVAPKIAPASAHDAMAKAAPASADIPVRAEGRPGKRHVTINDVARYADLSIATVSRVMHNSPRVSAETRQRVLDAIETLGYTPNALSRGLAMRSASTIGVLVISIADPYWAEIVGGIEDYAASEQYAVLIACSYEDAARERRAVDLFRQKRVDGVLVGAASGNPDLWQPSQSPGPPVVFINNEHIDHSIATESEADALAHRTVPYLVASDDVRGAIMAVEHLIGLGHRRIAYIGVAGRASSLRRLEGYKAALQSAAIPIDPRLIVAAGEGANHGEAGAAQLLAAGATALFCYDDMTALGALRAAHARGVQVPRQLSIVGYDDVMVSAYFDPPLTTVRQPMHEMGKTAMRLLVGLLRGEEVAHRAIMPGELVIRASTGPAPNRIL